MMSLANVCICISFLSFALLIGAAEHDPWMSEFFSRIGQPCNSQEKGKSLSTMWEENELGVVADPPAELANTRFGDTKLTKIGQVLTPTIVQNPPEVQWNAEPGAMYTILMTDPDAPSRQTPTFGEWYHWGVINIPGDDISKGDEIVTYNGAGPPKGTGLHRYVIMVFKQKNRIDYTGTRIGMTKTGRGSNKARDIARNLNLEPTPVAGACFQAKWDDYVPILNKKLS